MRVYCGQLAGGGVVDEDEVEGNAMVDGDEVVFEEEEEGVDEEVEAGADVDVDVEEERMEEREGEGVVLEAIVMRSVTIYFRW